MTPPEILIVGAGPTGLVLALWLARLGVRFRIVDKSPEPGRASRAMVVHARTLEFYRQLGIADEVVASGIEATNVQMRSGERVVATLALGDIGRGVSPYPFVLCLPQDDHERLLVAKLAAAGVTVERGVELKGLTQDDARVRAVLVRDGVEEVCEVAYLCGCDGAHSRVREDLGLSFPGERYDQRFYVADAKLAGPFRTDVVVNLGARSLGLMLPVRSSGMERLIGVVPEALAHRDDLTFDDVRASTEALLGVHAEQVNWFSIYNVHHRVAPHFRVGRCFIAGDAAHVHSPVGGQGMNTGIGDAVNLAWKLAQVLAGRADAALLNTYEPERIAFARTLVATTDQLFRSAVERGRSGQWFRSVLMPRLVGLATGLPALRRTMFRLVSQVRITYHGSALSDGRAGRARGGDRLPWVPAAGGADNFGPLRSLQWQLHIYGNARAELRDAAAALGLPVHEFAWSATARGAGLQRDAGYLVRPDGHVALASPGQSATALREFVQRRGLRFEQAGEGAA